MRVNATMLGANIGKATAQTYIKNQSLTLNLLIDTPLQCCFKHCLDNLKKAKGQSWIDKLGKIFLLNFYFNFLSSTI